MTTRAPLHRPPGWRPREPWQGRSTRPPMPPGWAALRQAVLAAEPLCRACAAQGRVTPAREVDHIVPRTAGGTHALANLQPLCTACHRAKTFGERRSNDRSSAMPSWLPPPACMVELVCGPPGSGKSTFVAGLAVPGDIIVDYDEIAARMQGTALYHADYSRIEDILTERNRRLAALARSPASATAWVIAAAPGADARAWWTEKLRPRRVTVLAVPAATCIERIRADTRRPMANRERSYRGVAEWWKQEDKSSAK